MTKTNLVNFKNALDELKSYLSTPVITNRDRSGVIQGFEFTFEQSWKSIQKIAPSVGAEVGNAKQAFELALRSGWIDKKDEMNWLKMIEDRNLTSHTYKEELSKVVFERTQNFYLPLFEKLFGALSRI